MDLNTTAASLHLVTGLAYLGGLFAMSAVDVAQHLRSGKEDSKAFTTALAWVGLWMGIHHVDHAFILFGGQDVGVGDLWTVVIAVVPATMWLYLRLERVLFRRSGTGDRSIWDHPWWVQGAATIVGLSNGLAIGMIWGTILADGNGIYEEPWWTWLSHFVLAIALFVVGAALWAQARHDAQHRFFWSLSGLVIAGVFPTCAATHLIYGANVMRGIYEPVARTVVINWIAAAAAVGWSIAVVRVYRRGHTSRAQRRARRLQGSPRHPSRR